MRIVEKAAPIAAMAAALSTLACCVPFGLLSAIGLAGLSMRVEQWSPWLLGGSVAFLCLGLVQLYFRKPVCANRNVSSQVLFWAAALVVMLVTLFPEAIASLIVG